MLLGVAVRKFIAKFQILREMKSQQEYFLIIRNDQSYTWVNTSERHKCKEKDENDHNLEINVKLLRKVEMSYLILNNH